MAASSASTIETATRPAHPQFRNDQGVKEIRIGAREFECIGQTPPEDHPHIYLEMASQDKILCPYCGTLFRYDPGLEPSEAMPPQSLFSPH